MKKGFLFLTFLLLAFCSCEDKEETSVDSLSVQFPKTSFTAEGETVGVAVTASVDWKVLDVPDWIVCTPAEGSPAVTKTQLEVKGNSSAEARGATVRFMAGKAAPVAVKVEQAGLNSLELTQDTVNFTFAGGKTTLEVHASAAWTVEGMTEWCSVSKESGEAMDVLQVEAKENTGKQREVTLTFKMGDLKTPLVVIQEGEDLEAALALERKALMKFYDAANGKNWSSNYGWGTDDPVEEWAYVKTNNDGRVVSLNFRDEMNLSGKLVSELKDLKYLKVLNIPFGNFATSSIPTEWEALTNLEEFVVKMCMLKGEFPEFVCKFEKLKILDINTNYLTGSIPAEIRNLKNLTYLAFDRNMFKGEIDLSGLDKLTDLYLLENKFEGNVNFLTTLTSLEYVNLRGNKFSGEIPAGIGELKNLGSLTLSENNFTGSLPSSLVKPERLTYLNVSGNCLSGVLPDEILNWEFLYREQEPDGEGWIEERRKYDWSDPTYWKRICEQQAGYGFSNAPKKPVE